MIDNTRNFVIVTQNPMLHHKMTTIPFSKALELSLGFSSEPLTSPSLDLTPKANLTNQFQAIKFDPNKIMFPRLMFGLSNAAKSNKL